MGHATSAVWCACLFVAFAGCPSLRSSQSSGGTAMSVPAVGEGVIEIIGGGGEPPGLSRHLVVKSDGEALYTKSGFTDEAGVYQARVDPSLFQALAEAIEHAGKGEGPFVPDTVAFRYRHATTDVAFEDGGEPPAIRKAQRAVLDVVFASPVWTVAMKATPGETGGKRGELPVIVTITNRGQRSVKIDHPAAPSQDGTRLITDIIQANRDGLAGEQTRWQPIKQVSGPTPPAQLEIAAGASVDIGAKVMLPDANKSLPIYLIYGGTAAPEGGEPMDVEIDTRFPEPEGLR
jgi:hypothetical protein